MKKVLEYLYKTPLLLYALILLVISIVLFIPTDPDFFWHLKLGEITLNQGIVNKDPFSHTFSDYPFIDFEWLSHLTIFLTYKIGNFHLVSILYSSIILFALIVSLKNPLTKNSSPMAKIALLAVTLLVIKPIIGIRPQMISILGLSLTYFLLIKYLRDQSKTIFLIPVIMVFWTNAHPGFLSGLLLIIIVITAELIKKGLRKFGLLNKSDSIYKKQVPRISTLVSVLLLTFLATFITPYFYKNLGISIFTAFDTYAMDHIQEWLTPNFHKISGKLFIFYILFVTVTVLKRKKINITEILTLAVFGTMAFNCVRHMPLFAVISIPSVLASTYWQKITRINLKEGLFLLVKIVLFLSSTLIFIFNIVEFAIINKDISEIYEVANYPYKAVEFLKLKKYEGNILNYYRWGGFLIWEYPEKKVFIDGRMASWHMDGRFILREYNEVANLIDPDWQEKLEEYDVKIILTSHSLPITNALKENANWEVVYEDTLSVVLHKKEPV